MSTTRTNEPDTESQWAPKTPVKPTLVRPHEAYFKIPSNNSGCSFSARILAEETIDSVMIAPVVDKELKYSDGFIDLNKSIWEADYHDSGTQEPGGSEGCVTQVTEITNDSEDSGKGVLGWERELKTLGNAKACVDNAVKSLDFLSAGGLNKGLYSTPLRVASVALFSQASAKIEGPSSFHSSSNPETGGRDDQMTSPCFQVSEPQAEKNNPELGRESFLPENHDVFLPHLKNETNRSEYHAPQYGQEKDVPHRVSSFMGSEKLHHAKCSHPMEPVCSGLSTPPKHKANKRPNNGTDEDKPLQRKPRRKKHRPKVVIEDKPKRMPKRMPNLATPKCASSKNPSEKREKRKYVRKTPSSRKKNSVAEPHAEVAVKSSVGCQLGDGNMMATDTTIPEGASLENQPEKRKRCKYIEETPSSNKSIQQNSVTEHHIELATKLSTESKPGYDNMMTTDNANSKCAFFMNSQEKREKESYARRTLTFNEDCQHKSLLMNVHHTEVAGTLSTENEPGNGKLMAADGNLNQDFRTHIELGTNSIVQPMVEMNIGAPISFTDLLLGIDSIQLKWGSHGMRSAGEYLKNRCIADKNGCQFNSCGGYHKIFKVNSCISNSRRVGPNFPKICKKRRVKRRRKLNMFDNLLFSCSIGHTRKRRSKTSTRRGNLAYLTAIPISDQMPNILLRKTHQDIKTDHELEASKNIEVASWGQAPTGEPNGIEMNLMNPPPEKLPIIEEQGFQTSNRTEEYCKRIVSESCIKGLSLKQTLTSYKHGIQIIHQVEAENNGKYVAESCIEGLPLKQTPISDQHGIQIIRQAEAENNEKYVAKSSIDARSSSVNSKLEGYKSKRSSAKHKKLQVIAKSRGPQEAYDEESSPPKKLKAVIINSLTHQFQLLKIAENEINALVPYQPPSRKRRIPRVDLDMVSLTMWNQLIKIDNGEREEKIDKEKQKRWEAEREVFRGRIQIFTSRMHQILGDRRFKSWKGSVVDSVVGVYLTQNVSDNLSSSAYMSLAAKFPLQSTYNQEACDEELDLSSQESIGSNIESRGPTYDPEAHRYFVNEPEPDLKHELDNKIDATDDGVEGTSSVDIKHVIAQHFESTTPMQEYSSNGSEIVHRENPENASKLTKCLTSSLNLLNDLNAIYTLLSPSAYKQPLESPSIFSNVCNRSNNSDLMEDFRTDNIEEQKLPLTNQKIMKVDPSISSGKSFMAQERKSQEVGIQGNLHSCDCDEGQKMLKSENITADKPKSCPNKAAQRPNSELETACDDTTRGREKQSGMTFDETRKTTSIGKKKMAKNKVEKRDWDSLRRKYSTRRRRDHKDSVDWEAVRHAEHTVVAKTIKERGQHTIIARRIQDFLNRVVELHKSIDLEWLRNAPPDEVKKYLLEIPGLGLKSVECVRLLALQQKAFPVDTNVGRIAVRLGWVPLEPLPGNLQIHLLEEYPIMDSIQKYLWPRLCELDTETLYELHYQMITFGKVFCTKKNPNCKACPMKEGCKHYASATASAIPSLPGLSEKCMVRSTACNLPVVNSALPGKNAVVASPMSVPLIESNISSEYGPKTKHCEPIVEEPKSPQYEQDIEDTGYHEDIINDDEEILTFKLNNEELNASEYGTQWQHSQNSQAIVPLSATAATIPARKLKNVSILRTEHEVYELPDGHNLLTNLEAREHDDANYLLAIWMPGETANSCKAPKKMCNSQGSELCNDQTCFSCENIREQKENTVRGTILIPCRTALKGRFPLNGTYFQVNEVFADHETSYNPIKVSRDSLWHLRRRTVYIGTSVSAIFREGLSTEEIEKNFWTGFICVRGFERQTGAPRPLAKRFHCPQSKMEKDERQDQ